MSLFSSSQKEVNQPAYIAPQSNSNISEPSYSTSNVIGKGTVLTGDIESASEIKLEGKIDGNIHCKSKVTLTSSAIAEGNIYASNAEISGEVIGLVEIKEMLILKSTAIIHGDIQTGKLVIEAGAKFNGSCKMGAVSKEILINPNTVAEKQG